MKLYDLTHNYQNLLELMDNEDIPQDEITAALNGLEGEFNLKAENIAKLLRSMEADTKAIKDEEKRLSNRRKALENRCTNLKTYLSDSMRAIGKDKIKGDIFTISFRNNAPSLNITDASILDKKYLILVPSQTVIDNGPLKEDLKNGVLVNGAELISNKSLMIK